jgi:hypothetical protein
MAEMRLRRAFNDFRTTDATHPVSLAILLSHPVSLAIFTALTHLQQAMVNISETYDMTLSCQLL